MQILHHTPEFKPSEVVVAEELIDACLEDPVASEYSILVAEVEGQVAGYVCYGPTPLTEGTWDIYWIATARERRRQGIGRALMDAAEEEIRKTGGRLSVVETSSQESYETTRRFYASIGYPTISVIPDFYTPGDDKLTLVKRLR